jgi:hypothetical protein
LLRSLRKSDKSFNVSFVDKHCIPTTVNASLKSSSKKFRSKANRSENNVDQEEIVMSSLNHTDQHTIKNNSINHRVNSQARLRSYNKITLMVVVLCFTNLICQIFTFVFIFEAFFNQFMSTITNTETNDPIVGNHSSLSPSSFINKTESTRQVQVKVIPDVRHRFPKFLAYSLLLNNICLCINHSCNIFIYIFTNPRFKSNLIKIFRIERKLFFFR